MTKITHLFFDLGGVCLTNAWDHISREKAARHFGYDFRESDIHHEGFVEKVEIGELSRENYLKEVVFYQERNFSEKQCIDFMENQSQAHPKSFEILEKLRLENQYSISVLNNESLELNLFRINKLKPVHKSFWNATTR